MKEPIRILCILSFVVVVVNTYGQMHHYDYKRELKGVSDQWHKVILPNEIFGKTSQNLSDIRIMGLTANNDTIEVPYLLRETTEVKSTKDVAFQMLNTSYNEKGYYFTFEIPTKESINQIKLDFIQENFDWRVSIEGSHNQKEWFKVVENQRIVSINNDQTDFEFTKVILPNSKYSFFRMRIGSEVEPELISASIAQNEFTSGKFRKYGVKKIDITENKGTKQTEINIELDQPVRASHLKINVADEFDYYRPITVRYLTDSVKTDKGWKYHYRTLATGELNSIEKNEFQFVNTTMHKLKILIENQDNQPLTIDDVEVKGYLNELIARFTDEADYYLLYGSKQAFRPNYDIGRFTEHIPDSLASLELGNESIITKKKETEKEPLFENKTWLWTIMAGIILLLGWFSIKMIRES